jgi:hypothetical protein
MTLQRPQDLEESKKKSSMVNCLLKEQINPPASAGPGGVKKEK